IIHETAALYTPQQNGVAERKNRALKEMVNSMLSYSGLSDGFWGEAMLMACYLLNRVPNKRNTTTPYELWMMHLLGGLTQVQLVMHDPRTFGKAMQSRDVAFWKEAINDEMDSIKKNNIRILSDLPPEKKEGVIYFDTYAPVACISEIRLLIALAATYNLLIYQMDVKTTFLNGDLEDEVYMKQSKGFGMPGNEYKVCKLTKSLYGLKQDPKQRHQEFGEVVLSSGFILNQSDKCVYCKFDKDGK
nr:zinc finger, CCHC-type [Tanacetum cinerariifolium]